MDTSLPSRLGFADDGPTAEDEARQAAADVAGLLDTHLSGAQEDQPDLAALGAAWLVETSPPTAEALRTGLASSDQPVEQAAYDLTVHAEPAPTMVVAIVEVVRRDGSTAGVELVFDVTGGTPVLHVAGPLGESA